MVLKPRDRDLLLALVQKVRLFSQKQIAEHWWTGEIANARRRMKVLSRAGLVQRITVPARTLPPIEAPLVTWQYDQAMPDFGQVAYQLQARWKRRAVRPTTAYMATERAAHGGQRLRWR